MAHYQIRLPKETRADTVDGRLNTAIKFAKFMAESVNPLELSVSWFVPIKHGVNLVTVDQHQFKLDASGYWQLFFDTNDEFLCWITYSKYHTLTMMKKISEMLAQKIGGDLLTHIASAG